MSEVKVNKISPRTACGTVTLGDSGDTFTIPSGATITNSGTATGFGGTGVVSWDTTAKTTTVTAATGVGYFVNTTSGSITVNLPAGAAGSVVAVADYANTADTNAIIIAPNGAEKIQGVASSFDIIVEGGSVTLVYVDGTQGWRPTDASTAASITQTATFISATGGNQPTASGCIVCTNYKVHKFTGPGTFCVSAAGGPVAFADYLVVAGGGAGGSSQSGGGGGGGGFRESKVAATSGCWAASPLAAAVSLPISVQGYPIVVGGGGTSAAGPATDNTQGATSTFSTIDSAGGGKGGRDSNFGGGSGGSGGGATFASGSCSQVGGTGNTPPVSPSQGNPGGNGQSGPAYRGAGGGGAIAAGNNYCVSTGSGGNGATTSISASPVVYAGGAGTGGTSYGSATGAAGGTGGGGAGATGPAGTGTAGTVNTGGGGGGGFGVSPASTASGAGGSGIVWIRYKFQ